jgi:hypothetical protein
MIMDIRFAPRNSRGMVEYSATFLVAAGLTRWCVIGW